NIAFLTDSEHSVNMDKLNNYQTGVILVAVIIGLLMGHNGVIARLSSDLIVPLLMVMLFGLFLSINLGELKASFLNMKFSMANIVLNFMWAPVFAYALGHLFLSTQ